MYCAYWDNVIKWNSNLRTSDIINFRKGEEKDSDC